MKDERNEKNPMFQTIRTLAEVQEKKKHCWQIWKYQWTRKHVKTFGFIQASRDTQDAF